MIKMKLFSQVALRWELAGTCLLNMMFECIKNSVRSIL